IAAVAGRTAARPVTVTAVDGGCMDGLVGILVLLALAVLAVPVLMVVQAMSLSSLRRRVEELERSLATLRQAPPRPAQTAPAPVASQAPAGAPRAGHGEPTLAELARQAADAAPAAAAASVADTPAVPPVAATAAPPPLPPAREPAPAPARATPVSQRPPESAVLRMVKRWFTAGNVPVKIGVLVLLAGVAALLKYAADQGLFSLPLELRLAGIAATALAALVFAWRRRDSNRVFALNLQGGAIGVLLLVVFAAARLYGLIEPVPAFALSVVLVAGAVLLAVLQNAQTLAAFALLAGYLAPVWLSTGSGNHVALFSYYALLNTAVVVIAWFKAWRPLNLLGFVFTFGIGSLWGLDAYVPEKYATTQPYLALFFVFYLA